MLPEISELLMPHIMESECQQKFSYISRSGSRLSKKIQMDCKNEVWFWSYVEMVLTKIYLPNASVGEGNGTPLQHSCLENPMDREAWWAAVHEVTKSRTRLSDFTFTFHFHALEKEMVTHSSVLAWRIPGTAEPGGLPSMGSHSRTRLKRLSSSSSSTMFTKVYNVVLVSGV